MWERFPYTARCEMGDRLKVVADVLANKNIILCSQVQSFHWFSSFTSSGKAIASMSFPNLWFYDFYSIFHYHFKLAKISNSLFFGQSVSLNWYTFLSINLDLSFYVRLQTTKLLNQIHHNPTIFEVVPFLPRIAQD